MAKTGYGWTASADPADFGGLATIAVGTKGAKFRVRANLDKNGTDWILRDFWRYLLFELEQIEPCEEGKVPDEWSYLYRPNKNDPNSLSQHAGGLAIDWNAVQHPNNAGPNVGWSADQVKAVKALKTRMRSLFRWGSDYGDAMHFEIAKGTQTAAGHEKIRKLVVEVVRPAFKKDPARYGLPKAIIVPAKPTDAPEEPPVTDTKPFLVPGPYSLLAVLDAPGAGNWQGACQNRKTGEWFIAEGRPRGGSEDAVYHHFAADPDRVEKRHLDSGTIINGGHQTSFGISDTNVIWSAIGGKLTTTRYRPGQTVSNSVASVMADPVAGATNQISLTPTRTRAVIRRVQTDTETYQLFPKDDNGKFGKQIGKTITVKRDPDRTVQGFGGHDHEIGVLTGHSNRPSFIERYSIDTGKLVERVDVTDWGIYPGEEDLKIEVEGLEGDAGGYRLGVKLGQAEIRELRVLAVKLV